MRWLWAFAIVVWSLGALNPAVAQQQTTLPSKVRANLNDAQLKRFRRQQLGIQVDTKTQTNVTANTYTWLLPNTPFLTTTGGGTKTISKKQIQRWKLYQGFRKIKEPEFFRITGYPGAARKAREWHIRDWVVPTAIIGGIAGIGGILWATSLETYSYRGSTYFRNEGQAIGSAVLAGVGLGVSLGALIKGKWRKGIWAPYKRIRSIATDYNRNLYEKLAGAAASTEGEKFQQNGYLPAETTSIGPTVEEALSLSSGAKKVTSSEVGSLQAGDVIISVGGVELRQEDSLKQVIQRHSPGDTVQLKILREGERRTVSVSLGGSINR